MTSWTQASVAAEIAALPPTASPQRTAAERDLWKQVAEDLMAPKRRRWKLPPALGGGEVVFVAGPMGKDGQTVSVTVLPSGPQFDIHMNWLIPVDEPSIDDPIDECVEIEDDDGDRCCFLEPRPYGGGRLSIRLRPEHLDPRGSKVYTTATFSIDATDLRRMAQWAWQRANAVEQLSTVEADHAHV